MNNVFIYDNTEYYIVDENASFKHPESREWVDAIAYKRVTGNSNLFIREALEWRKLFIEKTTVTND